MQYQNFTVQLTLLQVHILYFEHTEVVEVGDTTDSVVHWVNFGVA